MVSSCVALVVSLALAFPDDNAKVDASGDPLPAHAVARLGTLRWRAGGPIVSSALSRDGKLLVVASRNSIALMDTQTGSLVTRFSHVPFSDTEGQSLLPRGVAISPDNSRLAIAATDTWSGYWDLKTRKFRQTGDSWGISAFTPDGHFLVQRASFRPGVPLALFITDLDTGKKNKLFANYPVRCLSPDTEYVLLTNTDGKFRHQMKHVRSGALVTEFPGNLLTEPDFSPDSKWFGIINPVDRELEIWDLVAAKIRRRIPVPPSMYTSVVVPFEKKTHAHFHCGVAFTNRGEEVMLFGTQCNVEICRWNAASGAELPGLPRHYGAVTGMFELPDGKTLLTTGESGVVRRFDKATGRELGGPEGFTGSPFVALSTDGRLAAISDGRLGVELWDSQSWKRLKVLRPPADRLELRSSFLPRGDRLAIVATGNPPKHQVVVSDADGFEIRNLAGERVRRISLKEAVERKPPLLGALKVSPDGTLVALQVTRYPANDENDLEWGVELWDLTTGKVLWRRNTSYWDTQFAFAPDGRSFALAFDGSQAEILEARTAKSRETVRLGPAYIPNDDTDDHMIALTYLADGRLAGVLHDHSVTVSGLDGGPTELTRLKANDKCCVACSPDGRTFATATGSRVRLHHADGTMRATFEGHTDKVRSVAFDPTGRRLISSGADGQIYVWSVP